jgi:hypothetical protein
VSTLQIAAPANVLDGINPTVHNADILNVGQFYISGTKAFNFRTILRANVGAALAGWTSLTAARFVGNVNGREGAAFAATLRQITPATEEWDPTTSAVTYNNRATGTAWATAGADTPNSATDTNKTAFTSPAATGLQTIVSGAALLAIVNLALGADGILRFHVRSDDEGPGVNTDFQCATTWYLEVDGTAPAGGRRRVMVC